jgi:hypothetical protein
MDVFDHENAVEADQPTRVVADKGTTEPHPIHSHLTFRMFVNGVAVIGAIESALAFELPLQRALWKSEPWIVNTFQQHFAAIVGLPGMALLAFVIVVMLEWRFDKIEMELVGFLKFQGAAGPIVLWVLCFIAMALSVKLLW